MSDSTEAQPQGVELLHWRFRAGAEETMCGLSVHSGVGAALLPEAATCPLCKAAFVGYKFGRADLPRATADRKLAEDVLEALDTGITESGDPAYSVETSKAWEHEQQPAITTAIHAWLDRRAATCTEGEGEKL
jgi:hypothetical protein